MRRHARFLPVVVFACFAVLTYGCTAIVQFHDTDVGGNDGATPFEASTVLDASSDAPTEDGAAGDATLDAGPEADGGDDGEPEASAPWAMPGPSYVLVPDAGTLRVPAGCDPCAGYRESFDSFICGSQAQSVSGCAALPADAVLFCKANGMADAVGYVCPSTMPCFSATALGHNALCSPCSANAGSECSTTYTNSIMYRTEYLTCSDAGALVRLTTADAGSVPACVLP